MNEIKIITPLRGIAALMVALYHGVYTTTGLFSDGKIKELFNIGHLGVELFFLISGTVLSHSLIRAKYNWSNFWLFFKKRVIRIEPAYLGSIIVTIAYLTLRNYVPSSTPSEVNLSPMRILLHLGYLIPFFNEYKWLNQVYWTLAIEFQFYLLLALIFPFCKKKLKFDFINLVLIFSGFVIDFGVFKYYPIFSLGIYMAFFLNGKMSKYKFTVIFLFCIMLISLKLGFITSLFLTTSCFFIIYHPNLELGWFSKLGLLSYSFYLLNDVTGSAIINFLTHFGGPLYFRISYVVIGTIVSLICSYVLYKVVEVPTKRLSSSIKYK